MRQIDEYRFQGQGHGLVKVAKWSLSKSISSAIFSWRLGSIVRRARSVNFGFVFDLRGVKNSSKMPSCAKNSIDRYLMGGRRVQLGLVVSMNTASSVWCQIPAKITTHFF